MNRKRVLFVVLPYVVKNIDASRPKIRSFLAFPYGVLSIATYIKDVADVSVLDMNYSAEGDLAEALNGNPDIIGFTMMFDNSYASLNEYVCLARSRCPGALIILGGAAASYWADEMVASVPGLDAVCFSEGEMPMRDLILDGELSGTSWVTRRSVELANLPKPQFVSLDDVIDIDYSFTDVSMYDMQEAFSPFAPEKNRKQFFLLTSRGCPFQCTFCSNSKIHGKKMRFASVEAIDAHVGRLVREHGMEVLTIYDDQLLIDKSRAKQIFAELAKYRIRVECPNGLSPRFIDREMAFLMKAAGMDTAYLAIEHGVDRILKDVIKKPLSLEEVPQVVGWLHEAGIFCHGFFVIGMPGETYKDRLATVKFVREVDLDWAGFNPATPVRGSELYDMCIKNKWIVPQDITAVVDKKYIINAPEIGLTPEIIDTDLRWMNLIANFRENRRMRIGDYETAAKCFRQVLKRYSGHKEAERLLFLCEEKLGGVHAKT